MLTKLPQGTLINLGDSIGRSIVGCWRAAEGGGSKVFDSSGLKNHLSITSSVWSTGLRGRALLFSGTPLIASSASRAVKGLTVAAWINPGVLTRGDLVTCWTNGTANSQFDLLYGITSGKPQFFVSNGTTYANSGVSVTTISVGKWYFIVGTYDGVNVKIYINGRLESSSASSIVLNKSSLTSIRLGDNATGDGPFSGRIDSAFYCGRALAPSEILRLYQDPDCIMVQPRTFRWSGVDIGGSTQTITCTGIASGEAFGTALVGLGIVCTGIASVEAFGTATVGRAILATGIASTEAFGTLSIGLTIVCAGIASAQAFGSCVISVVVVVATPGRVSTRFAPSIQSTQFAASHLFTKFAASHLETSFSA